MYVKLDRLIDLIHRSLANGRSVVAGTSDHRSSSTAPTTTRTESRSRT